MSVEFNTNIPIYIQIIEDIKLKIVKGIYLPGNQVPTVRDLAMQYGVNPNTVQKALSELEREGLMKSERTNGRFISIDQETINELKEKMSQDVTKKFLIEMQELGINKIEAVSKVKEYREVE